MSALIFLDYDGTLVNFTATPELAKPDAELVDLLIALAKKSETKVVLISGRDRPTMEAWFGHLPCGLVAEHGAWIKPRGKEWSAIAPMDVSWKQTILPILRSAAEPLEGSVIEDKDFSISWHYRQADQRFSQTQVDKFVHEVTPFLEPAHLQIIFGKYVVEIRVHGIDKGQAVLRLTENKSYESIIAIGDDRTDEDMFVSLPSSAITIKVGKGSTQARYRLENVAQTRKFLKQLTEKSDACLELMRN